MAVFLLRNFDNMRPSQHLDQHLGMGLTPTDLLAPFTIPMELMRFPSARRMCRGQMRNQNNGAVVCDKEQFKVSLDVQQFAPEEVQVKVVGNSIVVEAKHEDKQDEHGFISRQFVRKYIVPEGHDVEHIASSLSSDGVLNITVPKVAAVEDKERVIPITYTGPHKVMKAPAEGDKEIEEN